MYVRHGYLTYSAKKNKPSSFFLLYILMYLSAGIQANFVMQIFGYFMTVHLLLIIAAFLTIEFDWPAIRNQIVLIGLIYDIFSTSALGVSALSLWLVCLMIGRIKRSFYIEYLSTNAFLLFILILGYCFLVTLLHYILQDTSEFIRPFTQLVIMNAVLTLVAVPVVYPFLKVVLHGKK